MLRLALGLAWPNPRLFCLCKVPDLYFVIQVLRSDPAFGLLCLVAIQDSVNSPPIKKKKRANNNPAKYSLCVDLCTIRTCWKLFCLHLHWFHSHLYFMTFICLRFFFILFFCFSVRKTVATATAYASLDLTFSVLFLQDIFWGGSKLLPFAQIIAF